MTLLDKKRINVLLVEDNAGDAVLLREALREFDSDLFALTRVERLSSALEHIEQNEVDLILLDLSLPDAHGIGTFTTLHQHAPEIPTVVLTGLNDEHIATNALREGAQDYLVKGQMDGNMVARSLQYAIERKKIEETLRRNEYELRRLATEQAVLAEIGRIISSSLNLNEVFGLLAEQVKTIIPFDRIVINLVDKALSKVTNAHVDGIEIANRPIGASFPLNEGSLTSHVLKKKSGLIISAEVESDMPEQFRGLGELFNAGIRSLTVVPLISKDVALGGIILLSRNPQEYGKKELELAESVALQVAGTIANARLHSDIVTAETALRESELRYRRMIEMASDIVYTTDLNGHFTYVNPIGHRMTEYSEDELLGKHYTFLIEEESKNKVRNLYLRQFMSKSEDKSLEFPIVTKSGKRVWIEQNVNLISSGQEFIGFQAIGRDITRRKEYEAERENIIGELKKALAEINTLSGLLPICSSCKKIRDDKGYWNQIEGYIRDHSDAEFSHSICPDCFKDLYPQIYERKSKIGDHSHTE